MYQLVSPSVSRAPAHLFAPVGSPRVLHDPERLLLVHHRVVCGGEGTTQCTVSWEEGGGGTASPAQSQHPEEPWRKYTRCSCPFAKLLSQKTHWTTPDPGGVQTAGSAQTRPQTSRARTFLSEADQQDAVVDGRGAAQERPHVNDAAAVKLKHRHTPHGHIRVTSSDNAVRMSYWPDKSPS